MSNTMLLKPWWSSSSSASHAETHEHMAPPKISCMKSLMQQQQKEKEEEEQKRMTQEQSMGMGGGMSWDQEEDKKILSFEGVTLRQSDRCLLQGSDFLNDQVIEFYFQYLSSSYGSREDDILLVPPSISFWLTNPPSGEDLKDVIEPLRLNEKKLIFFTVNNNVSVTKQGGSHWSLLVYYRETNTFAHHDSCRRMNSWHARQLYGNVKSFVHDGGSNRKKNNRAKVGMSEQAGLREAVTPQQSNAHDCGLYVLKIADCICDWYRHRRPCGSSSWFSCLEERVDCAYVEAHMRRDILNLVDLFKK